MSQPAGWYPQPDGTQRYWDGSQWTSHVVPAPGQYAPPASSAPSVKRSWYQKKRVIIPAVAVLAVVGASIANGGGNKQVATSAAPSITAMQSPASAQPTEPTDEATEEVSEDPSDEEEADEPDSLTMTTSQEQAVRKAEQYIEYTAFSRAGLIKQLKYEGFSASDAKFGADHIDVDWMEQAVLKAKDYLEYTAFSRNSLIKQLEYEGFTRKQAEHGAKGAGL